MKNTNVKPITGRQSIIISRETPRFSPEVYVLAGTLVPDVSTNTTWFGGKLGIHTQALQECRKNQPLVR
jgi:hypothetical protein